MSDQRLLRRKFETDEDYDVSSVLAEEESAAKYSNTGWKNADPDSAKGLAWCFSESLPGGKWGMASRLDLGELRHLTKYVTVLLEEHELPPAQIREMISAYKKLTASQSVPYPVGKFWSMRRLLIAHTAPPEPKNYVGWLTPSAHDQENDDRYAGWLK